MMMIMIIMIITDDLEYNGASRDQLDSLIQVERQDNIGVYQKSQELV